MTSRIELFVQNVAASADFYVRVLGFSSSEKQTAEYTVVRSGGVQIGLGALANLPQDHPLQLRHPNERKGIGVEIVIEVDDVDAFYEKVRSSGYPIQEALTVRPWGLKDFRLQDPDGYYLRITSR
ncbi:VOC family protein [Alicyclobacillus kakegawensis]|uniref:VOC family protein n=1 Tax=Alicyclobacillus kakegawensis TaxID=392012 RepID=UPI001FE05F12|nr:VOC family protein [Alicyclobacillus kakegawensis]